MGGNSRNRDERKRKWERKPYCSETSLALCSLYYRRTHIFLTFFNFLLPCITVFIVSLGQMIPLFTATCFYPLKVHISADSKFGLIHKHGGGLWFFLSRKLTLSYTTWVKDDHYLFAMSLDVCPIIALGLTSQYCHSTTTSQLLTRPSPLPAPRLVGWNLVAAHWKLWTRSVKLILVHTT